MFCSRTAAGVPDSALIIYVPGLKVKPSAPLHRQQLMRCLVEGVRRIDPVVAGEISNEDAFHLVSWTYDFYGEHRDIGLDLADIDLLLQKNAASAADIALVTSWQRRFLRWLFAVADFLPFLIPRVATAEVEIHLRDFNRYLRNDNGLSDAVREKLKSQLRVAHDLGRPVLLLAHSMGSVIAYDALWQLSREEKHAARVSLFLTTGSPLGQKIVQRKLAGRKRKDLSRYPDNIDAWKNLAAIGELTAIDRRLSNDFAAMITGNLVSEIEDREMFNYYHMDGALNVHAEYGYLVNEVTARAIGDWWQQNAG